MCHTDKDCKDRLRLQILQTCQVDSAIIELKPWPVSGRLGSTSKEGALTAYILNMLQGCLAVEMVKMLVFSFWIQV